MTIKKIVASIALLSITSSYAAIPYSADTNKQLQQVVDDFYQSHNQKERFTAMAATVLIPTNKQMNVQDMHTFVAGSVGFPPNDQPLTANNLFEIGSITKSFTALIILQLQTEGRLSLNDTLGKWLPQYPQWKDVTLRQLLNMTSAIPNYSNDNSFLAKMYANLDFVWTNTQLLSYASPTAPLKINKEELFDYSNSNYILAALVIEKITQDSFENQLNQRILQVNGYLPNTFYPAGAEGAKIKKSILARQVHGYYYDEKTQKNVDVINDDLSWAGAAGALVADTQDVIKWVQLLYHGLLIKPTYREDSLAQLETVVSVKTGQPIATVSADDIVGFGLGVGYYYDKDTKQKFWMYKGSTLGFRVMYFWQPCNDVTTVVALNSKAGEGNPKSDMGDAIAEANLNLYKTIMKLYPDLNCANFNK